MKKKKSKIFFTSVVVCAFVMFVNGCKKENDDFSAPTVLTTSVTGITQTSAISEGEITSDGGTPITDRGICWSTNLNPTILDDKNSDISGSVNFVCNITGLTANTSYNVRAYATNSKGTSYGNAMTFTTQKEEEIVTDIDGNIYHTITIGSQVWMVENLRTTKYRNGDLIGTTNPATFDISDETTPKYQWAYNGDNNNALIYGRLYTWYAVSDSRKICPTGWHVPTQEEFNTLINYLGGEDVAANKLFNINTFKALMAGYRYYTDHFLQISTDAHWWTSSVDDSEYSYKVHITNGESNVEKSSFYNNYGLSVRCIKD